MDALYLANEAYVIKIVEENMFALIILIDSLIKTSLSAQKQTSICIRRRSKN